MCHQIIKLTQKLIKQQSITPDNKRCHEIIVSYLKKLGFTINLMHHKNTYNLWAYRGKGTTLAFIGHTDVVPSGDINNWNYPPFSGILKNGTLHGRGTSDMKGAIAAMLVATKKFITQHPKYRGRIAFLITSDEEGEAKNGTIKIVENLKKSKEQIDYCLIGEPSSNNKLGDIIKNGRRGSLTSKITLYGIQGHVAYPHLAKNPIHTLISLLKNLLSTPWDIDNKYFPPTSMQIISINSTSYRNNIIPGQAETKLNFRFGNISTYNNIKYTIENIIKCNNINANIEWKINAQPYLSKNGKLTQSVIETIKNYQKITPNIETSGGTSDGRFLACMNTEIIEFGLLNKTIHQINECVNIIDLKLLSNMYENIIKILVL